VTLTGRRGDCHLFFFGRTGCRRAATLARCLPQEASQTVAGLGRQGGEPCSAAGPADPGPDEPGIPRGGSGDPGRLPRRDHRDLRAGRPVHRGDLARGDAVRRMAGRRSGRPPAMRGRRLSRVPRRRPGQQARAADVHRRAGRVPGAQAGQAELGRAGRAARCARARAHQGVRRVGAVLRPAAAAVLGPAAPPVPGDGRHRGGDGGRGLRRVAPARLGPGPVARQGLPSGRP